MPANILFSHMRQRQPKTVLDRFHYGVCYYPEAWDPSRHASDITRIADAGFNYVRMGEGAWSYWEPKEGKYQFDLFDRVIELCARKKIQVILGTPTYTGPAWIAHRYPEVLRWNFERVPMQHGSRRFYNYTAPKYLELSDRICTALAEHYRGNDSVFCWQLDNEFNCHMAVSYAPSDSIAFRKWVQRKYGTLDTLNDAWGTKFWSQTYSDWAQIDLPHPSATYLNPSVLLDESRFISDTVVSFAKRQADILRKHNRKWLITHNGVFTNVEGPRLTEQLDFFSHDQYPLFNAEGDWPGYGQGLAQARSLSFPYGILEQQAGPGGQMDYLHRTPKPGEMRLWAWQSIAHGAKLLGFFRWRTCPYGSEQHWHGLIDADDRDSRRLDEAKQLGTEVKRLPTEFFDAPVAKSVGILRDFDNETNDTRINTYIKSGADEHARWYNALVKRHVPTDMIWADSDWRGYATIVAPHLKVADAAIVKKLEAFVRAGGTLILGAQSGLKDKNCHVVEKTPPGLLTKLAGIQVEDWTTLAPAETRTARFPSGPQIQLMTFVERLRLKGAEPIANWFGHDRLLGDAPAITSNPVGKGRVVYISGYCDETAIAVLLNELGIHGTVDASPEVEVIERRAPGGAQFVVLMNHGPIIQRVRGLPGRSTDLITGNSLKNGEIKLGAYGVAVVASKRSR